MSINQNVEECPTIPIRADLMQFPNPFEIEDITLYAALKHFKDRVPNAKGFIDNQKLVHKILQSPSEHYLPKHPLVNLLRHLTLTVTLSLEFCGSDIIQTNNCNQPYGPFLIKEKI